MFWQDLRYSIRSLSKSPLFTSVALLSLALGIGANTAIFSLMDQALLRPLPVRQPNRLVLLSSSGPFSGHVDTSYDMEHAFSYPMYRDFRDRSPVFESVLARFPVPLSLSWHGQTERVYGDLVSGNYFETLGVGASVGRTLTQQDDLKPGAHPVVVLSYNYWKRRFGLDPGALNQTILLNGNPMTIVGVAQAGFHGVGVGEAPDVFVPIMMRAQMSPGQDDLEKRRSMWLNIFARLKPGVSREQAEAAMNTFWRPILELETKSLPQLSQLGRTRFLSRHLSVRPGAKGISSAPAGFAEGMAVLMGMVGLLLLIACANVANLLIARATARQREINIRFALGASRYRIVGQLLAESLLLALAGGALGILVASWTGDLLLGFLPVDPLSSSLSSRPDGRVLLFSLALSLLTGLIFGLAPAFQSARAEVASTLKDQATGVLGGFGHARFRKGLVTAQMALSLILLITSGLFARSLFNIKNINPGFPTDHLMSFGVAPGLNGYSGPRMASLYERLQNGLSSIPGVRAVSLSSETVLSGGNDISSIEIPGYVPREDQNMTMNLSFVGPGYLATFGIPLLSGRDISPRDTASAPKVLVINETMAQRFFKNQNPLGQRVLFRRDGQVREVIGVARDIKNVDLREKSTAFGWFPYTQHVPDHATFYCRTTLDPDAVAQALRRKVAEVDANLPVFDVKTMEKQIDESIYTDRLVAALSAAFGVLATLLAAIGLYGVMAYMVVRRTREIGIRVALGADRAHVLRLVMGEVVLLMGIGVAVALGVSWGVGRLIGAQLFGVSGHDPLVISGATVLLVAVSLLAGYIPAVRASKVDPLIALRWE